VLSVRERIGYGVGDLGLNFYFQSTLTYLVFFYTEVFGIGAAAAASVLLVARVVDAAVDPLLGAIVDRTRSRHGRLRPYLLHGALPLAIVSVATFSTPPLGSGGKLVWAYLTYVGFGICFSVVQLPYAALTAAITDHARERTTLSTVRMFFAFSGGLLVAVGTLPLVGLFPDPRTGFAGTLLLYSAIASALLWTSFASTRERVEPGAASGPRVRESLGALARNPPLWAAIALFSLGMLAFTIRQTAALFYFKYNLGREDLIPYFFAVSMPCMMLGLCGVPALAARLGKAGGFAAGAALSIAAALALFFTPYDRVDLVFLWSAVGALGGAPIAALGWAMIPDTVEYGQWRSGVRAEATVYAAASFCQQLAKALGGASAAAALGAAGFVANAAQGATSLTTIVALVSLAPAAVYGVAIATTFLYRLDERSHAELVRALAAEAAGRDRAGRGPVPD
jgi:GPH family glycoside/pentoside/hexuronide:cation symporter